MLDFYFCDPERAELFQAPSNDGVQSSDRSAGTGESSNSNESPRVEESHDSEPKSPQVANRDLGEQEADRPPEASQLGRKTAGQESQASADVQGLVTKVESTAAASRSCQAVEISVELRDLIRSAVRKEMEASTDLQELVRSTIQEEMRASKDLRGIIHSAVHEEVLASTELRDFVTCAVREETRAVQETYTELRELIHTASRQEVEHVNGEVDLLHAQMLKLSTQVESLEARVSEAPTKQDHESMTNALASRTTHLNNRMSQLLSLCSDVSQQGDKLRSRFDGVIRHLNTPGNVCETKPRSCCASATTITPCKVDRELSLGLLSTRNFTPQALPSHAEEFATDMDLPAEGSALSVRGSVPAIHMHCPALSSAVKAPGKLSPGSFFSSSASTPSISPFESREPSLSVV